MGSQTPRFVSRNTSKNYRKYKSLQLHYRVIKVSCKSLQHFVTLLCQSTNTTAMSLKRPLFDWCACVLFLKRVLVNTCFFGSAFCDVTGGATETSEIWVSTPSAPPPLSIFFAGGSKQGAKYAPQRLPLEDCKPQGGERKDLSLPCLGYFRVQSWIKM